MDTLFTVVKVIFVLVALLMTFFILLQEGKGGGLTGLGGTKAAGVEGVTNPIRRFTGYLSAIFFLLAIVLGFMARDAGSGLDITEDDQERLTSGEKKDDDEKKEKSLGGSPITITPDDMKVEKTPKAGVEDDASAGKTGETDDSEATAKTGETDGTENEKKADDGAAEDNAEKTIEPAADAKTEVPETPAKKKTAEPLAE